MADIKPLDRSECVRRLRPLVLSLFEAEQDVRPWTVPPDPFYTVANFPFMRIRDRYTGDEPDQGSGSMKSRDPTARLETREVRTEMLTIHANHRSRVPTPFLSFTDSPSAIQEIAQMRRTRGRGALTLTVINVNVRRHKGLPVLNAKDEMVYYGVKDPYHRGYAYYEDHYLCLWEVTAEEIIGHYLWDRLSEDPQWYENGILPAFRRHEALRLQRRREQQSKIPNVMGPRNGGMRADYVGAGVISEDRHGSRSRLPSTSVASPGPVGGIDSILADMESLTFSESHDSRVKEPNNDGEDFLSSSAESSYGDGCVALFEQVDSEDECEPYQDADDDGEAEALQENLNTIIERNIEDNW